MAMIIVDGVTMPEPSGYTWGQSDISASESGRDDLGTMHKNRIGKKRKISLSWTGLTPAQTSQVLTAFDPEYISVTYPDSLSGTTQTRTFYSGDKSASVKIWTINNKRYETVSFDIVER
jgi:hypothetical protein